MQEYRSILWLVAMGFFMQQLDSTIINTALPNIAKSLHENPLNMQSVIVAYVLAMAVTIPASGWIADKYGLRKTYFFAIVLFSVASIGCALSQNLTQLIVARVFQGIGGALLQPVGRLTLLKVMPKTQLLAALSFVSIPGLIGPLIGPSLGGLFVEYTSWHWIFLMNVPIGLVGAFFTLKILPDLKLEQFKPFDFVGFLFVAVSMVSLLFVLDHLSVHTYSHIVLLIVAIVSLGSALAYYLHSKYTKYPLFATHIFKINSLSIGLLGNLFSRLGNIAIPFLLTLMLQLTLGLKPSSAGLMIIPLVLGVMSIKRFISPLVKKFGYKNVLVTNTILVGFGIASFSLISTHTPLWWQAIHFFLFGIFNSIQFTAMNTVTIKDLNPEDAGSGNSMLSVTQQLAMSISIASASAFINKFSQSYDVLSAFHYTFLCLGALTICSSLIFAQLKKATP